MCEKKREREPPFFKIRQVCKHLTMKCARWQHWCEWEILEGWSRRGKTAFAFPSPSLSLMVREGLSFSMRRDCEIPDYHS